MKQGDNVQAVTSKSWVASQIKARQIAAHSDVEVRVVNYVGGTDKARQIDKLTKQSAPIVIGTQIKVSMT